MRRIGIALSVAGLLASSLFGCGRDRTPVPAGAQQVHVTIAGSAIRLEPGTVHAGDVYVVLDTPGTSVGFAQRRRTAAETPGPLSDEDLDRLAHGDTQGTAISGFDDLGCTADQREQDRGQMGPCGNVLKLVLPEGRIAFFTGDLEGGTPSQDSIAVLDVVP